MRPAGGLLLTSARHACVKPGPRGQVHQKCRSRALPALVDIRPTLPSLTRQRHKATNSHPVCTALPEQAAQSFNTQPNSDPALRLEGPGSQVDAKASPASAGGLVRDALRGAVVVVVGAGPAGSMSALLLAKRGYTVHVYEQRSDPTASATGNGYLSESTASHGSSSDSAPVPFLSSSLSQPTNASTANGTSTSSISEATASSSGTHSPGRQAGGQRTYPMMLSGRVLRAVKAAGVSPACLSGPMCRATYMNGKALMKPLADDGASLGVQGYLTDRPTFARDLVSEALRLHPDRITYHWGCSLHTLDTASQQAHFSNAEGHVHGVQYDLLVGADGAHSAVRSALEGQLPGFTCETVYKAVNTYKVFSGLQLKSSQSSTTSGEAPTTSSSSSSSTTSSSSSRQPMTDESFPESEPASRHFSADPWVTRHLATDLDTHAPGSGLYVLSPVAGPDRQHLPMLYLWMPQARTLCGLITRVQSFESKALTAALTEAFPDLPSAWRESIVRQTSDKCLDQTANSFGRVIRCSALHGPRMVLVGDAGHAITSMLGQGANSACEDALVLAQVLDSTRHDLDASPGLYSAARGSDVRALSHMELVMNAAMHPSTPFPWYFRLYAKLLVTTSFLTGLVLNAIFPSKVPSPNLIMLILRRASPRYATLLVALWVQAGVWISAAVSALVGAGLLGILWWFSRGGAAA